MFKKLKEKFDNWLEDFIFETLRNSEYVDSDYLSSQFGDFADDMFGEFVGTRDFNNLEYDVEENRENIDENWDRIDSLEDEVKKLKQKIELYDKIFKKLKSVNSWEITKMPEGSTKIKTVTSVEPEEITEE